MFVEQALASPGSAKYIEEGQVCSCIVLRTSFAETLNILLYSSRMVA